MALTNPFQTIVNFIELSITRYLGINLMGERLEDIFNFLKLSDHVGTAGQPTEQQLSLVKSSGYKTVINLALPTSENALPDEGATVESLDMEYINIPVNFNNPTEDNFVRFCAVMQERVKEPIFVHCAANLRVSAFMYLYRRIKQNLSEEEAKVDLDKIWTPNRIWTQFIAKIINKCC